MADKQRGPEHIRSILQRVIPPAAETRKLEKAHAKWAEVAGESLMGLTRVLSFHQGTLRIGVCSSPLLSELSFLSADLLKMLNDGDNPLKVKDIRFTLVEDTI